MDTVHNLGERGMAFRSLAEGFDTTTAGGEFLSTSWPRSLKWNAA
ncbi:MULTISPECIES: hypothetical protein [Rhodococcus]|nr:MULTISPECIES: hypothetical protein [Rhodococcus]